MLMRLGLRLRIFLLFAALACGSLLALIVAGWLVLSRPDSTTVVQTIVQTGLLAGFLTLGLVTAVWYLFDLNVAKPIESLSGLLRARAHADVEGEIDVALARYLGDLAPAASAAARSLAETRGALMESVARETTRLASEKARLETLLSDVPVGVLLCSGDHRLAFYNGQAVELLGAGGLDRSLLDALHPGPIQNAYDRLMEAGDPDAASDLLCTTTRGGRILSARMRLLMPIGTEAGQLAPERPGYVLTLRDVTADLASEARREALLTEVIDQVRRRSGNLSALISARGILTEATPNATQTGRIDAAITEEVEALGRSAQQLAQRVEAGHVEGAALTMTRASDLLDGLRARLATQGLAAEVESDPLLIACNAFEIVALLSALAAEIAGSDHINHFRLLVREDGPGALIRLEWKGGPVALSTLDRRLALPIDPDLEGRTGTAILAAHATDIWPEHSGDKAALCLPIPRARRAVRRPKPINRSVVFDFDLLSRERSASISSAPLEALSYVVFDTETTGLLPAQGDEIVQIAAVRIVNGRRVEGEVFDTLVNPGRPIPPVSTEVHGITDAMVAEAPGVEEVCRQFHEFARGAVLIAHNAPFDMAFLRRREVELGVRFDNPILDTVLLSAVVFGQHEAHSLDALTHRLAITIPEEARHTAIGDTIATADAFLKMLPMLRGKKLTTFGDVLTEVRRHGRLLKDLN